MGIDCDDDGATPHMNPKVTMLAAIITLRDGVDLLSEDETAMVRGSTRPRAICPEHVNRSSAQLMNLTITWKKEASTSRRQRVLKTRPIILTETTGKRLLATWRSSLGI